MEFFVGNLIVAGLSDWGCVLIPTGLPAELIPQMFVPCLTTGVIIPALCRIVNHFRKIFPRKLKKAKQNPAQNIFPFCVGTFSSSCRCRGRVLFSDIGSPAFFFQEHRSIISSFLQANAIISMELHFRWWAGCTAWYAKRFMVRWKYDKGLFGQSSWLETLLKNQKIMIWWAW